MDFLSYLPAIVGVSLFIITLYIRSQRNNKPAASANGKADVDPKKSTAILTAPVKEVVIPKYGPVHIYFGSQTGAANNFANILSEEAAKAGFEPKVVDLVDFEPGFFKDVRIALFALATHGEGEPTENAKKFNEYIVAEDRTGDEFKGLKFSVFALGNKQYQFFCAQGRRANEKLEAFGGQRVYKYGEGDDNENLEDDFNAWKEGIWPELVKVAEAMTPVSNGVAPQSQSSEKKGKAGFNATIRSDLQEINLETYEASKDGKEYDFQAKQYLASSTAKIVSIRELRQKTDDGSTLHVEIDCKAAGLTYKTAQNLAIYPENSTELVNRAAKLLGLNLTDVFVIEPNSEGKFKHPVPSPISVKTYLTKFCDLQSAVRKKQLKDLAELCENHDNKNKLLYLASNDGKAEYEVQVNSRMRGLIDLIEAFDAKLTLENLIQVSGPILPRLYTIASSSKKSPGVVDLCVSLHDDVLADGNHKLGLTSAFLRDMHQDAQRGRALGSAKINIRDSTFSLPTDANAPLIMVGPGAGIAPFKGFIDEKAHLLQSGEENPYGEMTLYFGCRGGNWDHLYKEELAKHHSEGLIKDYHLAFSREHEHKVYVQDLIFKNKDQMSKLLFETNGVLYMCGSMAMGKSVLTKLAEIAAGYYKIELIEAQAKVEELEKSKKVIKELWG